MAIQRLRCEWSGIGQVGPGLSTFYAEADGTQAIASAAAALFEAVKNVIPSGGSVQVPAQGDILDETTGELVGVWGSGPTTTVTMTGSQAHAAGVGARVVWNTAGIVAGRRVRGATFLVPLGNASFDGTGTLVPTALTPITAGITAFLAQAGGNAVVWSRPADGRVGSAHPIVSGNVPDKVSWLRSRRT